MIAARTAGNQTDKPRRNVIAPGASCERAASGAPVIGWCDAVPDGRETLKSPDKTGRNERGDTAWYA